MQNSPSEPSLAEIIENAKPTTPLKKWIIWTIILAVILTVYFAFVHKPRIATGPIYVTESLIRGELALDITATGNLAPTNQVTVGSELSGTVAEVYVDVNDLVKKGQPIAKLDTTKFAQQTERNRAILLSAKARVSQTEATLQESEASLNRLRELHDISGGKTPSQADMDAAIATVSRAKADLESAKASVAQAEADLKSIERDLDKTNIRSPINGIILTRTIEVGQTVAASFTAPVLFLIAEDLKKMDLVVTVAEADIGRVQKGQKATFKVDAWPSRVYQASVKLVSFGSVITNNVVTYNTELEVTNDDLSLRPGMTATAEITVAQVQKSFIVPNAALRFDPVVAAKLGKPENPETTLVQSLSTRPRFRPRPQRAENTEEAPKTSPHIWILKDGKPVEIFITPGLTDGRVTEITGKDLKEGLEIIVTAEPPSSP